LQRGEGQLHLCFVAGAAKNSKISHGRDHAVNQRGLANARFAEDDNRLTLTSLCLTEHPLECVGFVTSANQHLNDLLWI
jgi:hypothetical protein